jgi:hypothetical protein
MEAFESVGEWWLPETPEKRLHGTLAVSERGRAELRLAGTIRSMLDLGTTVKTETGESITRFSEQSMARSGVYPRILGEADGKAFTLEDCFQIQRRDNLLSASGSSERILANQVYRGALFGKDETLEFCRADATMQWLPYWVNESGLDETLEFEVDQDEIVTGQVSAEIRIKRLEAQTCDAPSGGKVTLTQGYGLSGDRVVERRITQDFHLTVEQESLASKDILLDTIGDFQSLVTAGTGRPAAFKTVSFRHPDIGQGEGRNPLLPIDYLVQWQDQPVEDARTLYEYDMFFTLRQLGGFAGVENWLRVAAEHRSALNRAMAARFSDGMYVSDRLMNVAAALEAFDRDVHKDETFYRERLLRCVRLAGYEFVRLVGDVEKWATAMKKARNDIAHHNRALGAGSTLQMLLGRSAYYLFLLCILRSANTPTEVFEHIEQHGDFRWLQGNLADLLR